MKHTVDVFVSVIDNFGDIWFLSGILLELEYLSPSRYFFRIFTDDIVAVRSFLSNDQIYGTYSVSSIDDYRDEESGEIHFLLFHFPPRAHRGDGVLSLRIDYLSFDPIWRELAHERTHLLSRERSPIIELVPSFLSGGCGSLQYPREYLCSREELIQELSLPCDERKWCLIFCYSDLLPFIDFDDPTLLVLIAGTPSQLSLPDSVIRLPFLSIRHFSSIISHASIRVLRGEVSASFALAHWLPFLWDMYKGRGGWDQDQSDGFLWSYSFDENYRDLHRDINERRPISLRNIREVSEHNEPSFSRDARGIVSLMQKYIDSFDFSL